MKTILLALALTSSSTALACTPDELLAKSGEMTNRMRLLMRDAPAEAERVAITIESVRSRLHSVAPEATCALLDEVLAEIARAE